MTTNGTDLISNAKAAAGTATGRENVVELTAEDIATLAALGKEERAVFRTLHQQVIDEVESGGPRTRYSILRNFMQMTPQQMEWCIELYAQHKVQDAATPDLRHSDSEGATANDVAPFHEDSGASLDGAVFTSTAIASSNDADGGSLPPHPTTPAPLPPMPNFTAPTDNSTAGCCPVEAPPISPVVKSTTANLDVWLRRRVFELRVMVSIGPSELLSVLQSLDDGQLVLPFTEVKLWLGLEEKEPLPPALEQLVTEYRAVRHGNAATVMPVINTGR